MTDDNTRPERIELPGGWYFKPDPFKRSLWILTAPDGMDMPRTWGDRSARAFAAAMRPTPLVVDVEGMLDRLNSAVLRARNAIGGPREEFDAALTEERSARQAILDAWPRPSAEAERLADEYADAVCTYENEPYLPSNREYRIKTRAALLSYVAALEAPAEREK